MPLFKCQGKALAESIYSHSWTWYELRAGGPDDQPGGSSTFTIDDCEKVVRVRTTRTSQRGTYTLYAKVNQSDQWTLLASGRSFDVQIDSNSKYKYFQFGSNTYTDTTWIEGSGVWYNCHGGLEITYYSTRKTIAITSSLSTSSTSSAGAKKNIIYQIDSQGHDINYHHEWHDSSSSSNGTRTSSNIINFGYGVKDPIATWTVQGYRDTGPYWSSNVSGILFFTGENGQGEQELLRNDLSSSGTFNVLKQLLSDKVFRSCCAILEIGATNVDPSYHSRSGTITNMKIVSFKKR